MAKAKKESSSAVTDPACAPEWTDILREMIFIRRFEEATEAAFRRGKIGGYLHVYIGQEAIASGIISALQPGDAVFCGYRDHAQALCLGSDPGKVMAELYGKGTGISKGKGGSMHLFDAEHGLYGGYGIVGGHLPLAAGAAFAKRYQEQDGVVICYFGDGAMNIGSFHEAMNMAGLWGHQGMCPIIWVIENNGYAMGTALERHSALTDLSARVRAYDIPTEKIDGQDIFAVRGAMDRIVRQVRETGKPYCVEAVTYRFSGHGAADILQPYRSKEEVEKQKNRDPIVILRNRLSEVCGLGDADVKAMEDEAAERVAAAVKFAEESPVPAPEELFTDVVAEHQPRPVRESEHE